MVLAISPPEMWASKDDGQERLGKGSSLACHGRWQMGYLGTLGGYGEVLLQRLG